ncbi:hypothetical protein ACFL6D_05065 [Spirochaetota bacterium]
MFRKKILRLQWGFNPNSSSIGMSLHMFLIASLVIILITNVVIFIKFVLKRK